MRLLYESVFPVLWIGFLLYWNVMAAQTKSTERMEPTASRVLRALVFLAAIYLLCAPWQFAWLNTHLWQTTALIFWVGAGITLAGLLFCVWARVHLGQNWSRSVTIKQDHELIVTGPYSLVRHPIYTGLFVAFIGTALVIGQVRAVVAYAMIVLSLWYKLRLEEKWMRAQFGAKYEEYSSHVSAVVPFVF